MMKRPKSSAVLLLLATLCFAVVVLAADIESRQLRYCPSGTYRDQYGNCRVNGVPPGWVPVGNRGNGFYGYGGGGRGGGLNSPSRFFNNKGNNGLNPLRGRRRLPPLHIDWNMAHYVRITHGVMAALAFVIFFPFGAISVRILPGVLAVAAHAAFQMLGFVLYIIAFGLGLWMATRIRWSFFSFYQNYHPILGLIVFVLLFFQPILGALHHIGFRKHSRRGIASYLHIWLGRFVITLGMINGGLGLYISGNASSGQIAAYTLLASIIWVIWMIAAVAGEIRRFRRDVPTRPKNHHLGRREQTPPMSRQV